MHRFKHENDRVGRIRASSEQFIVEEDAFFTDVNVQTPRTAEASSQHCLLKAWGGVLQTGNIWCFEQYTAFRLDEYVHSTAGCGDNEVLAPTNREFGQILSST